MDYKGIKGVPKYVVREIESFLKDSKQLFFFCFVQSNFYLINRDGESFKVRDLPIHTLIVVYKQLVVGGYNFFKIQRYTTEYDLTLFIRKQIMRRTGTLKYFKMYYERVYIISQAMYCFKKIRDTRLNTYTKKLFVEKQEVTK